MAAVNRLFVVKLKSLTSEVDDVTQRWAWNGDSANDGTARGELLSLYTGTFDTDVMGDFLSPAYDRAANHAEIETYDITGHLNGSPHGSPIDITTWTLTGSPSTKSAPAQLACVVDYHADLTGVVEFGSGTRPRARRRGRHYWGALGDTIIDSHAGNPWLVEILPGFVTFLADAYTALLATATFGTGWGVWSRKDAAVNHVVSGWVDHTVHVQRRREDDLGIRTAW